MKLIHVVSEYDCKAENILNIGDLFVVCYTWDTHERTVDNIELLELLEETELPEIYSKNINSDTIGKDIFKSKRRSLILDESIYKLELSEEERIQLILTGIAILS